MKFMLASLSLREKSLNSSLIKIVSQIMQSNNQHASEVINLNMYNDIPYFKQEIQDEGIPSTVLSLKEKIVQSQALILSSPEYNYSMPGHFKNTLDWLSRCSPVPFANKPILLLSASMAMAGGTRGAWSLRVPLEFCGAFVYPHMFALSSAHEAFTENGVLKDNKLFLDLEELIKGFITFAEKFA